VWSQAKEDGSHMSASRFYVPFNVQIDKGTVCITIILNRVENRY